MILCIGVAGGMPSRHWSHSGAFHSGRVSSAVEGMSVTMEVACCRAQVSKATEADRIEKLGVSRAVGAVLIAAWLVVLVCTIVFRRRTDYETRKELHWWEAFYRTGSIIFGGGQVSVLWPYNPYTVSYLPVAFSGALLLDGCKDSFVLCCCCERFLG